MRSELDATTPRERVLGILAMVVGVLLFAALVAVMIYDKQRKENIADRNETVVEQSEQVSAQESSSEIPVVDGADIGLTETGEEDTSEAVSEEAAEEEALPPNTILLPEKETVTFTFAGDILLDDSYAIMSNYRMKDSKLEECVDSSLLEKMRSADVCVINNEFTYTERGSAIPNKTFTFRAKPANVEILKEMGVDTVSLANNHVYDFGEEGLLDTLDTLDAAGISYTGSGRNIEEASKILYYKNNSMTISLVCATQIERYQNPNTKEATETSPGTFRCYESERLLERIKEADANSDVVIAYLHWGTESTHDMDWRQTTLAEECAEAGADVIVGAHPHVIQGIGYEGDVPVFYSLGNFWFSSKNLDSALLTLEIGPDGVVSSQFQPCLTRNSSTLEATDGEKERILLLMERLSPEAVIDENGYVKRKEE